MKNIQLEKQYLHKSHSQYPNYQNRQVLSDTLHFFLFTGSPKGYDAIASICANAHRKLRHGKRIYAIGQVPTSKNKYITENHLQKGNQL